MLLADNNFLNEAADELGTHAIESTVLLAEAHIGEDAAEFFSSELGRYLIGRANQDIQVAMQKLLNTSAWRRRRIQELQNQIQVRELFKAYLLESINAGRTALGELESRSDESGS